MTFSDIDPSSVQESRNAKWPTREGDIRKKILKMTKSRHNVSYLYKDLLRGMIASFNDIGYFDGEGSFKDIRVIYGSPERTIAKLKEDNNIILPVISILQTTTSNDELRIKNDSLLVNEKVWNPELRRAQRVLSLAPRAVNINYDINIWTKYSNDMDQILEQIRLKFNPEMDVPTRTSTLTKAYLGEEEIVGSLSASDKEDRILKKRLSAVVRTYIQNPRFLVTSTGEIEELKFEGNVDGSSKL